MGQIQEKNSVPSLCSLSPEPARSAKARQKKGREIQISQYTVRSGNGENSVLACREWRKKCFGVAGMARKVFWRGGDDERRPRHEGRKGREIQIP